MMRLTRENFQRAISEARKNDDDYAPIPFSFGIPNAKEALIAGLEEVMRHKVEWLAEYDQIVNWLIDKSRKRSVADWSTRSREIRNLHESYPFDIPDGTTQNLFPLPSNRTLQRSNISYLPASAIYCHRRFRY